MVLARVQFQPEFIAMLQNREFYFLRLYLNSFVDKIEENTIVCSIHDNRLDIDLCLSDYCNNIDSKEYEEEYNRFWGNMPNRKYERTVLKVVTI